METPMCNHALFVSVHYYGEFSLWRPGGSNLDCNLVVSRIRKYTNKCDDDPTTIPMWLTCFARPPISQANGGPGLRQPSLEKNHEIGWFFVSSLWHKAIFTIFIKPSCNQTDQTGTYRNDRFQRQFVGNLRPQTEYPHQMPVQKLASISEFLLIRTLWEQSISQKHGPTSIIFNIFCSLLRSSNDPIWSNLIQSDPIWSNLIQWTMMWLGPPHWDDAPRGARSRWGRYVGRPRLGSQGDRPDPVNVDRTIEITILT